MIWFDSATPDTPRMECNTSIQQPQSVSMTSGQAKSASAAPATAPGKGAWVTRTGRFFRGQGGQSFLSVVDFSGRRARRLVTSFDVIRVNSNGHVPKQEHKMMGWEVNTRGEWKGSGHGETVPTHESQGLSSFSKHPIGLNVSTGCQLKCLQLKGELCGLLHHPDTIHGIM